MTAQPTPAAAAVVPACLLLAAAFAPARLAFISFPPAGSNPPQANSATINNLVPSQRYAIEVRALSSRGFQDSPAATLASLRPTRAAGAAMAVSSFDRVATLEGWQCLEREGYNVCSAGKAGLCEPITCTDIVRRGQRTWVAVKVHTCPENLPTALVPPA